MRDNIKISKIYLILFLLIMMSTLFSVDVFAANNEMFCSLEEIQNFEDAGYDENAVLYFKSDKIYSVYSSFDNVISFDDEEYIFEIEDNFMTIGYKTEDGIRHISSYGKLFQMYDYKDACILRVNENLPVKDKTDTFITNEGVRIVNSYSDCFDNSSNIVIGNICALTIISNNMINSSFSSPVLSILAGMFVICSFAILIYLVSGVFKRL